MGESSTESETIVGSTTPAGAPLDDIAQPGPSAGARLGRYLVLDSLGRGGMGEVLLAYDPELDRRVAIKLLRRGDRDDSGSSSERLLREAKALARLAHPNVVAVFDVGTVDASTLPGTKGPHGSRIVYIAMEFVEGQTLATWLETQRPWRERLAIVRAAGAGLAAAHREGMVHRDFKPANVIVGDDGRVRVLDFGLARTFGPDPRPTSRGASGDTGESSRRALPSGSTTAAGFVMGTPAYMAPEQFAGDDLDARTDQFAFCIVLFRALFGVRPFAGKGSELERAVRRGKIVQPDGVKAVPRRVREAIVRGLRVDPDERHRSMDALLLELDRGARPPVRVLATIGAGGLVVGGVALGAWTADPDPCMGASELVAPAWGPQRRDTLGSAFTNTRLSFATDSFERSAEILDAYATQWTQLRDEACIATRVRGDQSEELMDLRVACLDARLLELAGFVDVLIEADRTAVEKAVSGARALSPLAPCSDTAALRARVPPPTDAAIRQAVDEAQGQLARAKALNTTGQVLAAAKVAEPLVASAKETGYLPLEAEAAYLLAYSLENAGRLDEAEPVWIDGVETAAASGDTWVEAKMLIGCTSHWGYHKGDLETGMRYARHARGVVRRAGDPPELLALLLFNEGTMRFREGLFDESEASYRRAAEVAAERPALASIHSGALLNLGAVYGTRARFKEAEAVIAEALALTERELGPRHPATGIGVVNLGASMMQQSRFDEAEPLFARAKAILSEAYEGKHPELAKVLHNEGQLHRQRGNLGQAQRSYEEALEMKLEMLGEKHPSTAYTRNNLADVFVQLGEPAKAAEYAGRALAIWEETVGKDHAFVAYALATLGESSLLEGDADAAVKYGERALEIRTKSKQGPGEMSDVRFLIARAKLANGDDPGAAYALLRQARAEAVEAGSPNELERLDKWLAAHPAPGATP